MMMRDRQAAILVVDDEPASVSLLRITLGMELHRPHRHRRSDRAGAARRASGDRGRDHRPAHAGHDRHRVHPADDRAVSAPGAHHPHRLHRHRLADRGDQRRARLSLPDQAVEQGRSARRGSAGNRGAPPGDGQPAPAGRAAASQRSACGSRTRSCDARCAGRYRFDEIVGTSPALRRTLAPAGPRRRRTPPC